MVSWDKRQVGGGGEWGGVGWGHLSYCTTAPAPTNNIYYTTH